MAARRFPSPGKPPPSPSDLLEYASEEAAKSYQRALALVTNDSERRFLERRLREVAVGRQSA
jgi:predicted RNA polymerase sigma factor